MITSYAFEHLFKHLNLVAGDATHASRVRKKRVQGVEINNRIPSSSLVDVHDPRFLAQEHDLVAASGHADAVVATKVYIIDVSNDSEAAELAVFMSNSKPARARATRPALTSLYIHQESFQVLASKTAKMLRPHSTRVFDMCNRGDPRTCSAENYVCIWTYDVERRQIVAIVRTTSQEALKNADKVIYHSFKPQLDHISIICV
jgi:hypothetical protein